MTRAILLVVKLVVHEIGLKATNKVYCISLVNLISQLNSSETRTHNEPIWNEISELQTTSSSPLSIKGSLFEVGGMDKDYETVATIHMYHPDTMEWVKVGVMPTPRYDFTCIMINTKEMLVVGGAKYEAGVINSMYVALVKSPIILS